MKRLGVDLGAMGQPPLTVGAPECPGALVRLTRHDFDVYVRDGEHFETKRQEIPFDGYGSARVQCRNLVAQLPKTAAGYDQFYGLCHSCSGLEAKNRQDLRERARVKGER